LVLPSFCFSKGKDNPNVAKVEDAPRQIPLIGEMGHPRLSHRVNNMAAFDCFQDVTWGEFQQRIQKDE